VDEQPGEVPEDRPLRQRRPANEDLAGDERHVRPRDHRHENRRDEEGEEQIERRSHH
jgi:hypothetical protein